MNTNMSRRDIVISAACLLGATAVPVSLSSAQSIDPSYAPNEDVGGVSIVSKQDPSFATAIGNRFPGLNEDVRFQSIAASSALVSNRATQGIRALSLEWLFVTPTGGYRNTVFYYVKPGVKRAKYLRSGQVLFLSPHQTRLVTPFFAWSQQRFQESSLDWSSVMSKGGEYQKFNLRETSSATSVALRIDAVVYSDWSVVGTDTAKLTEHMRIRRNAEHDEALSFYALVKSNAPTGQIISQLKQHRSVDGIPENHNHKTGERGRLYYNCRALTARMLLRRLKGSNMTMFGKDIRCLVRQPIQRRVAL